MTIGGKKLERTITNIVLVDDHFEIYLRWSRKPSLEDVQNNKATIEYYID
jgi:hypothetical protein